MTYKLLEEGLKQRGFIGIDEIDSLGGCHTPDEKHYILTTDGLVIYSSLWDWHDDRSLTEIWCLETSDWDTKTAEFSFEELDKLL